MMVAASGSEANLLVELYTSIDFVGLFLAVAAVAAAYLASRGVDAMLDRLGERMPKYRLVAKRVGSFVRFGLFLAATAVVVVALSRGNQTLLYGLVGTALVAAGLGLKGTVSSLLSGVVLLVDQPFQVGDQVEFQDVYGEVTEIGLRSVRIWTREDEEVTIPNHRFLTEAVESASGGDLDMMVEMEFQIAASADHELARELVRETCVTSRYSHLDHRVEVLVREEEKGVGLCTVLTCRAYVFDARNDGAFKTDVVERVREGFREHGIARPYQQLRELGGTESEHRTSG